MTPSEPRLPTLSAVIPTIRPLGRIRASLDFALRDATVIEVVLVVDGPSAATLGPELDALDAATPRLRVLRLPEWVGAVTARQIGAEAALGEVVWFIDDDVVPAEGSGAAHANAHAETGADIIVGLFTTAGGLDAGVPGRLYDDAFRGEWARFLEAPSTILNAFWAGNHSIRRSALLPLGTIPSVFQHTYHADRAFGLLCQRAGLRAVARPELTGTHAYAPTLDRWRRDCRRQGAGRVEIHRSFSDVLGPDIDNPWQVGLGRRGRLALSVAEAGRPLATAVAGLLAAGVRVATRLDRPAMALEFGKILRSVEQFRGAEAASRSTADGLAFLASAPATRVVASPAAAPAPADVTLLVVSRGPGVHLRRVLDLWRPHVAEIVVVADRSGDPGLLEAIGGVADRTATVDSAFPIESVLERCWPLCRRPFVFRADDDEVPTTILLAELRSLTLDPTLQQAGIPMRWLWPDVTTWIDGYPWTANPQPKLIRNLAGFVRFPGRVHTTEHLEAPIRSVNLPVYHLRTLDSVDDRRARIARYSRIGGGRRHFNGRPANSQYLPEDAGDLRLVAVPAWDVAAVAEVVSSMSGATGDRSGEAGRGPAAAPGPLRIQEPMTLGAEPRLPDEARRVSVRVAAVHPPMASGARVVLEVVIANRSGAVLPGGGEESDRVSFSTRWRRADDQAGALGASTVDGKRIALGEPIPPGRAVSRVISFEAPVGPGRWRVAVDLVEESVAWFGDGDEFVIDLPRVALARTRTPDAATELFQVIKIETHNACNRHCWFCKFGQERRDSRFVQMDWDTIRRILASLRDVNYRGRISWYDINEPLVDKRIFDILTVTREYCPDAFLSLATNGDLLTPENYEQLKQSGLDVLGVTAYDDETFARVGGFADARMVLMDMRGAGSERLENRGGNVRRNQETFEAHRQLFADRSCERPSVMMVVKATGHVVLCCADMYADVVMGHVQEQPLEEIWNSERFVHYRRTLNEEGRRNLELCRDCSYSGAGVRPFFPLSAFDPDPRLTRSSETD